MIGLPTTRVGRAHAVHDLDVGIATAKALLSNHDRRGGRTLGIALTVVGFAVGLATLALVLVLGRTSDPPPARSRPMAPEDPSTLKGAGSTSIQPLMARWLNVYWPSDPVEKVQYDANGSAAGVEQFSARALDFGVTDAPLTDAQLSASGRNVLHVPLALGAVVPAYNLPGLAHPLRFSPGALARIFLGEITVWNDPEIASTNADLTLPPMPVVVVHRADGGGTSYVWVDYLSKVSPEWKAKTGTATHVDWPVGRRGKGNEGVADTILETPGAIGYLELAFALHKNLVFGEIQNAAGRFVEATAESITAAATGALPEIPADLRYSMTDSPEVDAWPVSATKWALIDRDMPVGPKRTALLGLLRWALHGGQDECVPLGYAPLPFAMVDAIDAKLSAMTAAP
jgi:phosphate transport system substrate-binding protein